MFTHSYSPKVNKIEFKNDQLTAVHLSCLPSQYYDQLNVGKISKTVLDETVFEILPTMSWSFAFLALGGFRLPDYYCTTVESGF